MQPIFLQSPMQSEALRTILFHGCKINFIKGQVLFLRHLNRQRSNLLIGCLGAHGHGTCVIRSAQQLPLVLHLQANLVATVKTAGESSHSSCLVEWLSWASCRALRSRCRRSRCKFSFFVLAKEYSNVDLYSHALVPLHEETNTWSS